MKHTNTAFYQLLRFIPKHRFNDEVKRHQRDHRVRQLNCWSQFIATSHVIEKVVITQINLVL